MAGQPLTIKRPKTEGSERKVTMPDIVVDALRDHRRQQLEQRLALGFGRPASDALLFPPPGRRSIQTNWSLDTLAENCQGARSAEPRFPRAEGVTPTLAS